MGCKTKIIAEIGENHHGVWELADKLAELAAQNGADIVKFQSYKPENFSPDDPEYDWFKRVALPDEKHFEYKKRVEGLGAEFMSSPFTTERAHFLCENLGCKSIKVASGVMANFRMLDAINSYAATLKKVYLSTGMATIDEIHESLKHLDKIDEVAILHCVVQYPAKPQQANLRCIPTLIKEFPGHEIGYSDHVPGLMACITAVALGAVIIEKHFTISRQMPGTDHFCAMDPAGLAELVANLAEVELMLGSSEKGPIPEELEIKEFFRTRFDGV